jgi:hypothetical protein
MRNSLILIDLTTIAVVLLGMGVLEQNRAGELSTSPSTTNPYISQAIVPNPYCRSQPTGDLPPLDVSDMRLWNYDAAWHASHWANNFSYIPWRSDHVTLAENGDVVLKIDQKGGPQIKSGRRIAMADRGTWEVEVTLPEMRDGMVVAPLWLYNERRREEIDFEFAGTKSLDLSIHAYPGGIHRQTTVSIFEGMDFSNCTVRFKIVADIQDGWASMYVENTLIHRFEKEDLGYFLTGSVKPIIEVWAARDDHLGFVQWLGKFKKFTDKEAAIMRVHGYSYSPEISDR